MIKITSPYPYQELKRMSVNGKRLYENPWGDPVPSVTTILDKTKPAEKRKALANWKKRVGEKEAQKRNLPRGHIIKDDEIDLFLSNFIKTFKNIALQINFISYESIRKSKKKRSYN